MSQKILRQFPSEVLDIFRLTSLLPEVISLNRNQKDKIQYSLQKIWQCSGRQQEHPSDKIKKLN